MVLAHHFCTDSMLRLANGTAKPNLTHAVEWLVGFIGPDGFAINSLPPFAVPVFIGEVGKSK